MNRLLTSIVLISISLTLAGQEQFPCYKIRLKSEQYPVFSQSIFSGVYAKGGKLNYSIELQKERTGLYVHLSICNRYLTEQIKALISEEVVNVLSAVPSLDNISQQDQWKLNTLKAINHQLEQALKNPSRQQERQKGWLKTVQGMNLLSTLEEGDLLLTTRSPKQFSEFHDKEVVVNGYRNEDGSIEVENLLPVKPQTLELFVMSQCPFGVQAAEKLIDHLKSASSSDKPTLEVRYIFYRTPQGFTSMRGEEEMSENLIQMTMRDLYGEYFFDYLLLRAKQKSENWRTLAQQAGLSKNDQDDIENHILKNRESMIAREYDYVANKNKILDGSPSYVYEGIRISKPDLLPGFHGLRLGLGGGCEN